MSPLLKITATLAGVLVVSCLLAPGFYFAIQALSDWPLFNWLADFPFHRYFSRVIQVTALIAVVPLLFWLGIWHPRELGLKGNPRRIPDVSLGVLAALLPAAILGVWAVSAGVYRLRDGLEPGPLLRIFLTAGFVACIEEFLFRGILLGLAVRAMGAWKAALAVSFAFAAVHFLRPVRVDGGEVTWLSGFAQAFSFLSGLPSPALLAFGFATLLFAGLILAWATLRTHSLWLAIGLHAGWILGQQGLNWAAKFRVKPPEELLPWIGPGVVSGVVPTGLLPLLTLAAAAALTLAYLKFFRREVAR